MHLNTGFITSVSTSVSAVAQAMWTRRMFISRLLSKKVYIKVNPQN